MAGPINGSAKSRPGADRLKLGKRWYVFTGPADHGSQYLTVNGGMLRAVLPRRTDEQLAGLTGLHVEGDGVCGKRVRALEVTEFDELVANEARVTIGDNEVSFASSDGEAGC